MCCFLGGYLSGIWKSHWAKKVISFFRFCNLKEPLTRKYRYLCVEVISFFYMYRITRGFSGISFFNSLLLDHEEACRQVATTFPHWVFCVPLSWAVLRIRIRDPGPFWPLDPGSGMDRKSASGSGFRDEQPGSYFLELRNHFFVFWG